jgi:hypothetical protein
MPRRNRFTVDAESVQGNAGATVTFRCITMGEVQEFNDVDEVTDRVMLQRHILSWSGIVDDDDHEMPNPTDEPDILGALYVHEQRALVRLLWAGPDGPDAKN